MAVTTDLVIKNCDSKFADMIKHIHRANEMRIKCGIQINFSGNPQEFSFFYLNVHPDNATKLVNAELYEGKNDK